MKTELEISGGQSEDGVVVGNTYDKYGSRNPVVRWIMRGFETSLHELVGTANPRMIHEVGCGEGYWVLRWAAEGLAVRGSDFSETVIDIARANARSRGLDSEMFRAKSIYDLEPNEDKADLVVCCEVLEHLDRPEEALQALHSITGRFVILSVPREPIWSALNMARGQYIKNLGNTPGHIQRWSQRGFVHLVSRFFDIVELRSPLPWTMLLGSPVSRIEGA